VIWCLKARIATKRSGRPFARQRLSKHITKLRNQQWDLRCLVSVNQRYMFDKQSPRMRGINNGYWNAI
jgi:hypothetical protein